MPRVLTGIQSSGKPHLGNILGAIEPALELSNSYPNEPSFFFIADLHSLTTVRDAEQLKYNTNTIAAAWLACGLDTKRDVFYRQSRVTEVCEFTWYLSCFTPYPMLANAHSFKEKSAVLSNVSCGLFTYPVLMAADILLYDAEIVPVGKDQQQHIEMARDIATSFNSLMGETLILPSGFFRENMTTVPGTDGRKMSKSYNNTINIFEDDKTLKKNIMSIVTDSTPLEEPKNPDTCNVFALYKLVASNSEIEELRRKYLAGGFGYGHAKQALLEVIMDKYSTERASFQKYINEVELIEEQLQWGEEKARSIAIPVLERVRKALGYS